MKYVPLPQFDIVSQALNFSTIDKHVVGGCDLLITKPAKQDKKLCKKIYATLDEQHESNLQLARTVSRFRKTYGSAPTGVSLPTEIDVSCKSAFGPLSQKRARKTLAHLIATLNASHTDYDFSLDLRPSDFRRVTSLRRLMYDIDSELYHLRRGPCFPPSLVSDTPPKTAPPVFNERGLAVWSVRMWALIDDQIKLHQSELYRWAPQNNPLTLYEGDMWSKHYLFYNRREKRVCYLHYRVASALSRSAPSGLIVPDGYESDSWCETDEYDEPMNDLPCFGDDCAEESVDFTGNMDM
ncbi:Maf1-domain-containing protein [Piedraia hortae CBS 480.64]|uniref:Repressor of RNA polymerase III transcription MAF1 n=1 Tax=Piedraia hortae CBS 480.64 TaxID=1314780 RepID=A0A6A7BSD9_9PEZI|nr:Maf1-domain-containing protein [Piedraia hortae CBS 480.64]